jgi:[acyl-carrier-protein] S-malonyltransferase
MFTGLIDIEPARTVLQKISDLTGLDLNNLADPEASGLLTENRIAQILVVGQTLALHAVLDTLPKAGLIVAGYSVGDLAAHAIAGSLSVSDTLGLSEARATAMDRAAAGSSASLGMTAVRGLSISHVKTIAQDAGVEIALINGPDHVVVGGPRPSLHDFETIAARKGAHVKRLGVGVASHTSYLASAGREFEAVLQHYEWRRPRQRLLSPIDGAAVMHRDKAIKSLGRQIYVPLDWANTMHAMREYGVTATLELGAGRALTKMIEDTLPEVTARATDDFKTLAGLSRWIARLFP